MADIAILEGFLKHRDGRKWKQRWCVLKRSSPIADRLSMTLYKDRADKNKDGREKATHSLEDFCGIESGLVVDGVSNVMAIVCQQRVLLLAFESREKMLVWELKIRSTIGEGTWRFPVVIPSGSKFPTGPAMLHFYSNYFCLTHGVPPKLLWCWQLQGIRRYGAIAGGFSFEAGSKCGKGSGLFYIHTEEADSLQMLFNCVASGVPPPRMDLRGSLSHHPSTGVSPRVTVSPAHHRWLTGHQESVASEGIYTRYLGCSEDSLSLSSASSGASYGHATELTSESSSPVLRRNFSRKSYEHLNQDSNRSSSSSPKHLYDTPNKAKELYDTPRMHHAEIGIVRPMSQSQDMDQPFAMSSEEDLPLKVDSRSQSVGAVNYDVPKNLTKLAEKIPAVPSQGQDDHSHRRDTISSSDYMELGSDGASSLSDMKSLTDSAIDTASFSTDQDKRKSPDPDTADEVFECSDGTLKKDNSDGEEDTSECGDMDEDLDKLKQEDEKDQRITSPASPVPSSESGRGSQYEMMTPPGSVTGDSAIMEEEGMIGTYGTMAENQGHARQHSLKAYLQMKPMRSHSIGGAVGRKDGPEQWYQVPRELCSPTVGRRGQGRPLSRASSDETSSSSSPKSVPREGLVQEPLYQVPRKLCSMGQEEATGEDIYDNVAMKRWQLLKEKVLKEQEAEKEAEESAQRATQSHGGPVSSYEDMQPAMEKEAAVQERPKGAEGVHVAESYEAMEPRNISKNVPVMKESYESMVPGLKQQPVKGVEEEEGPQYENLPFWQQQKQQQLAMEAAQGQAEKSPINYEMMDVQFDEMPMADTYGAILGKTPVVEETYQVCPKGSLGGMSYEDMQPSILKKDPFCLLNPTPSSSGDSSKEFFTLPGRKVSHDSHESTDKFKTLKTFKGVPSPSLKRKVLPKELQGEYENVAGLIRGTQGLNIQGKGNGYEVMEVSNKGKTEMPSSDISAEIYQNLPSLTTSYKEGQKSTLKDIPAKEQYELMATLKEMEDYEKSHNSKGQKSTGGGVNNSKKRGAYMDMAQKVQKSSGKPRLQQLQGDLDDILSGETETDPTSPKLTRASSAPTKRISVKDAAQMYEVMTPNQSAEASQYRERCHTDPASPKPRSLKGTDSSFNYEVMNPEVTHAGDVLQRRHTDPPSGTPEKCTKEDVSQFPLKGSGKKKKHESSACTIERPRHGKSYGKVNRGKILKGGISESESESSGSQASINTQNTESGTMSPPTSPSHNPTAAQRLDIARSMAGSSGAMHSYMNIPPVSETEPTYMNLPSSHQHSAIVPEANYMNIPKSTEHIRKQLNYLSLDVYSMGGGVPGERDPTAYAEIDVTATQSAHKAGLQHAFHSRKELLKDKSDI
ncbi:uncharacterized protein LOC144904212 isoform X1 [Branchiostoma floridae x Branchiostoma belcheri]